MTATILRRRYRRLLGVYPSEWRAANETVVLDTLLEAAGPDRHWPSARETLALLVGGGRARIARLRPDAGQRGRRWLDGLHLGAILLTLWWLAVAMGPLVSWLGHGFRDVSRDSPAYDGPSAAYDSVWVVMAAVTAILLLRGRVKAALVALAVWALASLLKPWVIGADPPEGTVAGSLAMTVLEAAVWALPLLAILAVLAWRGGVRSRSWAWLLLPTALVISYEWAPMVWTVTLMVLLVGLLAALPLAVVTGEVRPAVVLAIAGMHSLLSTVLTIEVSVTSAALAVTALAGWGAFRTRQGSGITTGGPISHEDA
ncbi:hypothetical protein Aph01nite_65650 [Acrocarpospora phusangensis]|uniref:Uncharacterized protein n=1 Tax=Acrocarpospora phusangensis TaxID=1070424 RepID=A0A919QL17_9ACTN|nr:hypothetical protein [Acrocarpospora phusangensis]GIH28255.1 hypothetical protein Aph01nite_65650 [Acrocarpospora phusangensis]